MIKKLALGTVQFGLNYGVANQKGQVSIIEAQRILSLAKEKEIDVLDTAISYGASEEVLGKLGIDDFRVITKLPEVPKVKFNFNYWLNEQVKTSLLRLNKKNLYGLLLHRSQDLSGPNGKQLIQMLRNLKNTGVVHKIGVSIYSPEELKEVCKTTKIDLVQAPLNIIDRRLQTSGWLDRLKDNGVEVHTRSVFLQGLLLMDRQNIPEKFSRWSKLWEYWHDNLNNFGISPLAACLAYPLSLKEVDRVIIGVDSVEQFSEVLFHAEQPELRLDTTYMKSEDLNLINPSNWNNL